MEKKNKIKIHNLFKVEYQNKKKIFTVYYRNIELKRLQNNKHIFIIEGSIKKDIQEKSKILIKKDLILKLNFSTLPFDLKDPSFYHKRYMPYCFQEDEMIKSAERQWESQRIANKIKLAPEIFFTDYNDGIIYTIMEKIENDKIEIITGEKNFHFAYKKRFEILESLKILHDNNVIHGDILTSPSIYTGQIHNIYYDNDKISFIDFGESRNLNEGIEKKEFEKWKKIEMELVKEKLFTKIDPKEKQEYIDIDKILEYNYNSNI
tara:strand:+ start:215 stop:1003 length:789 start_codon:yes stop_codon:yes gene_type:complete